MTVTGITAGAIRWDAWYDASAGGAPIQAQYALSPTKWRYKAPWFAASKSSFLQLAVGSQANMDLECQLAAAAGLKYWGFVWYGPYADGTSGAGSTMNNAWNLFQASPNKGLMKWCGIIGTSYFGTASGFNSNTAKWQANVNQWVTYFKQSNYLTVLGGRPVLYLMYSAGDLTGWFSGSIANVAAAISYLRSQCTAAGLGNPYVVLMAGNGATAHPTLVSIGADALSNYTSSWSYAATPDTYSSLDTQSQAFWPSLASQGDAIIPICQIGWDTRARKDYPESWVGGQPRVGKRQTAAIATPSQFAAHVTAAINYIGANPSICPSKTLLMYSWTECDEGGALIPTIGDPPVNTNYNSGYSGVQTSNMLNALAPVLLGSA
ncbi:hypothetical protein [Bradyrhizobium sp. DASA03007]|uniref:hypothetical protein n=1 Tax=unclassified Bradyrhizobium TaxID=2631580 RepID=UPI003F6E50C5